MGYEASSRCAARERTSVHNPAPSKLILSDEVQGTRLSQARSVLLYVRSLANERNAAIRAQNKFTPGC